MALKILHISDIHFKHYKNFECLDLDKDIQREIEHDLSGLKSEYGTIDVILIGGDIAFSGKLEEYAQADQWIKRICEITGCKEENVLMVPGNHDVDRSKFNPILKNLHQSFKTLRSRRDIDYQISEFIRDPESASILLSPFHNYRAFAQKYGSIPEETNLLYWEKDFNVDNCVLRIRGVNSALISNETDEEHTSKLILGSHQSNIVRDNGVVYLVLCHHPPQWLYDMDDTVRDFNARAKILLYGHKHSFSADTFNNSLVLSAGAMQPSRNESDWEPRYNIIDLQIDNLNDPVQLAVKLYERKW
ncbi:MAG TPA: metallophosphoesterase, partial [Flavobacterium sp.]|uniref:metallophosphoesterase family protein n=3 Tax=Flavobacterium TaxID=237 RepID=UPI002ED00547